MHAPTPRRSRAGVPAAVATLIAVAVASAGLLAAVPASADPIDGCTATHGAIVAVDFGHWGGPVVRGCDADPTTGMNLLHNGGFSTTGTVHDGPGFVCRIGTPDFQGGTEHPTPTDDPCTVTPPTSAYWSYWIAPVGQDFWTYSPLGALSDVPADGEVEAWTYGATDVGGTTGQPAFAPDSVRAGGDPESPAPPTAPPSTPGGPGGPGGDLAAATAYLTGQLTDGDHVFDDFFGTTDYPRTAQVGIGLAAAGSNDDTLSKIVAYLGAHIDDAVHSDGPSTPPDPAAASNIALLVEITGGDPHDVGGRDLIAELTDSVCTAAGNLGNCGAAGDFFGTFSPFTQATGVLALARAGAVPAAAVTRLAQMQCADGGFPGSMISPGDFCDPENDMTGLAAQALSAAGGAGDAVGRAGDALAAAQQGDGGFLPFTGAAGSDTASTSLDAEALRLLGQAGDAARAVAFVAARQQDDGGFAIDANTPGSDLYATVNAVPALAGTTLATVTQPIGGGGTPEPPPGGSAPAEGPDLAKGSAYLVDPANLVDGHYYEAFAGSGFADFGLTIDGAFALAATGADDPALGKIVAFLDGADQDGVGHTINDWTGIGTSFASGGSVGKEALLAEVVGDDPRDFGGHDLIAALDTAVCAAASTGSDRSCAAAGNYTFSSSTFSQALGIIAQIRAGATAQAPIAYLESLQHPDGSFPSLIPSSGDSDVDSTAMAAMALDLVPGEVSTDAVSAAVGWIAGQQEPDGGFPGVAGDSVNSAALAIQGLTLRASDHQAGIDAALEFLAGQQNSDGGFAVAAGGQRGSDVRASAQAVSGAVGTSFGVLRRDLDTAPTPTPTPIHAPTVAPKPAPTAKPARTPAPRPAAPREPAPVVIHPATRTAPVTAKATSPTGRTPVATARTGAPGPLIAPAAPATPAVAAPSATAGRALAGASSSAAVDLWWVVLAVAVLAAAVIAVLFLHRRRPVFASVGAQQTTQTEQTTQTDTTAQTAQTDTADTTDGTDGTDTTDGTTAQADGAGS